MTRPVVRLVPPLLPVAGLDLVDRADPGDLDVEVLALPVRPAPRTDEEGRRRRGAPGGARVVLDDAVVAVLDGLGAAGDLVAAARAALDLDAASGRPGSTTAVPVPGAVPISGAEVGGPGDAAEGGDDGPRLLLLAGVGEARPADLRRAAAAVARRAARATSLRVELLAAAADADADAAVDIDTGTAADGRQEAVRACVEGLLLASYSFARAGATTARRGRDEDPRPRLARVDVAGAPADAAALARGEAVADATAFTRDLVNTPAAEATPAWLAAAAEGLPAAVGGGDAGRLSVDVLRGDDLAAQGFGGVVAVGAGSAAPPCLVTARWEPAGAADAPHVVLVGKGITFDTGGLSLKPPEGMTTMKTDMAGGATVLGALRAVAELALPVRLTVLVPAAENMPSGSATRPGDVVTHRDGRTSEVLNTDAEGRLVLADALAHAAATLAPDALVDVATLTGAVRVALGTRTAGLFTAHDDLAAELTAASSAAGEPLWRLPLVEEYRPALDSDVADLRNVGDPDLHLGGGAITAALFLQPFAGGTRWAHLDVAGAARSAESRDEVTKGSSGWGVRLLVRWLEALAAR